MSDKRKIRIDVLTLDSVQCAACGYMMESIAALPSDVQTMIEYKEWSVKTKEGIKRFMELKGEVLPTICIEERPGLSQRHSPVRRTHRCPGRACAQTTPFAAACWRFGPAGFDFDKIRLNLAGAGAGQNTRIGS